MAIYELKVIQDRIVKLYNIYSAEAYDKAAADDIIMQILYYKRKFVKYSKALPRISSRSKGKCNRDLQKCKFMAYCLDTLFEILEEGSHEKTRDFLHILIFAPNLVTDERDLGAPAKLAELTDSFRRTYGNKYFERYLGKKDMPKNKAGYFSSGSSMWFRKTHPVLFPVLLTLGILSVVAAIVIVVL